ncbi:dicarboxylate/amino acid:cation symporter [Clostridium cylindrosporum]|uniref:dicarboxylate/amino acid:cation symporter n=1 Tax=Clostridium cylindrosporum TaxID=1495 RepID=UPI00128E3BB1|nr:cation:dicarboxylase symporter family transporter [Clostridium cylindrosporum]
MLYSLSENKMIPVVIFSLFVSSAMILEGGEKTRPVKEFIDSLRDIMSRVTKHVIELVPYGVIAIMTSISAHFGLSSLLPLTKVLLSIYVAYILQIVVVQGILVAFIGKVSLMKFIKKIYPTPVVAFTTQTSIGTLLVTLRVLTKRVNVSVRYVYKFN